MPTLSGGDVGFTVSAIEAVAVQLRVTDQNLDVVGPQDW